MILFHVLRSRKVQESEDRSMGEAHLLLSRFLEAAFQRGILHGWSPELPETYGGGGARVSGGGSCHPRPRCVFQTNDFTAVMDKILTGKFSSRRCLPGTHSTDSHAVCGRGLEPQDLWARARGRDSLIRAVPLAQGPWAPPVPCSECSADPFPPPPTGPTVGPSLSESG